MKCCSNKQKIFRSINGVQLVMELTNEKIKNKEHLSILNMPMCKLVVQMLDISCTCVTYIVVQFLLHIGTFANF